MKVWLMGYTNSSHSTRNILSWRVVQLFITFLENKFIKVIIIPLQYKKLIPINEDYHLIVLPSKLVARYSNVSLRKMHMSFMYWRDRRWISFYTEMSLILSFKRKNSLMGFTISNPFWMCIFTNIRQCICLYINSTLVITKCKRIGHNYLFRMLLLRENFMCLY